MPHVQWSLAHGHCATHTLNWFKAVFRTVDANASFVRFMILTSSLRCDSSNSSRSRILPRQRHRSAKRYRVNHSPNSQRTASTAQDTFRKRQSSSASVRTVTMTRTYENMQPLDSVTSTAHFIVVTAEQCHWKGWDAVCCWPTFSRPKKPRAMVCSLQAAARVFKNRLRSMCSRNTLSRMSTRNTSVVATTGRQQQCDPTTHSVVEAQCHLSLTVAGFEPRRSFVGTAATPAHCGRSTGSIWRQ